MFLSFTNLRRGTPTTCNRRLPGSGSRGSADVVVEGSWKNEGAPARRMTSRSGQFERPGGCVATITSATRNMRKPSAGR
jgi:hypothetical protein